MRSTIVCTLFCLLAAGYLHAEQTSMAELSKNLPEDKVQTINGRWMIKVRVPIEGTASTARKIAQINAESIGKGKILEHACTPQRDGRLGKLIGVITELATNRINIDGDVLEVIMSAPVQKPKCTFESSESKKNASDKVGQQQNEELPRPTSQVTSISSPQDKISSTSTPSVDPTKSSTTSKSESTQTQVSTEPNQPVIITRETGTDY